MKLILSPSSPCIKKALYLFFSMCMFGLSAQNDFVNPIGCGTTIGPEEYTLDKYFGNNQKLVDILLENNININKDYLKQLDNRESMPRMNSEMFKQSSRQYDIPIKAWIYRNNNGTGNISSSQVYQVIDELNSTYSSTNTHIRFYLLCDISIVNNSNYANYGAQHFSTYTASNRTPGAINVHFVYTSAPHPNEVWGGLAYLPWQTTPYSCAVQTIGFSPVTVGNILSHEIGHNLGLRHTHDTARSGEDYNESAGNCYQEAVSRSKRQGLFCVSTINKLKCEVNGDGLCDTAADPGIRRDGRNPYSYLIGNSCTYNTAIGGQDNWGGAWMPNTSNIMSYSWSYCRNYFSPLQVGTMYGWIDEIGINHPAFTITGPNYLCGGQPTDFTTTPIGSSYYTWEVPNGVTILSGQGTNSITVQAIDDWTSGQIVVTPNCGGKSAKHTILSPRFTPISGPEELCPLHIGATYTAKYIPGATYNWTLTNGSIMSGQGSNSVTIRLNRHSSNLSLLQVTTGLCGGSGGGAQYIAHTPPGPDCRNGQILPDRRLTDTVEGKTKTIVMDPDRVRNSTHITTSQDFAISPNPASHNVTISMHTDTTYNLNIFDVNGKVLLDKKNIKERNFSINVDHYQQGIYFIQISSNGTTTIKRLIIKK